MRASDILNTLGVFSFIPGAGSMKDFHVVFNTDGKVIVNSGIMYSEISLSLGIDTPVAVSWKRFSSLLSTLGTKDVVFSFENNTLRWKSSGPGYNNTGTMSFIDPSTILSVSTISIPDSAFHIPVTKKLRDSITFYIKSIDFDNYSLCRGVVLLPRTDHFVSASTNGVILGISNISDMPSSSVAIEGSGSVLVPYAMSQILANSENHLHSDFVYWKSDDEDEGFSSVKGCGYIFDHGFIISSVENYKDLDFEKYRDKYVPMEDVPYVSFSSGLLETIDRMTILDDGWDVSITKFTQKDGKLTLGTSSGYGTVVDEFDIPFEEESSLNCVTKLLKKAANSMSGVFPIHSTNGAFVFTDTDRSTYLIVSPATED